MTSDCFIARRAIAVADRRGTTRLLQPGDRLAAADFEAQRLHELLRAGKVRPADHLDERPNAQDRA